MKETETAPAPGTYFFFNLGCHKNLVDADGAAAALESVGWRPAADPALAELLVITTCAFIAAAEQESVDEILRVAAAKSDRQRLAVLGCLVSREGEQLHSLLPEVDFFLPVDRMDELAKVAGPAPAEAETAEAHCAAIAAPGAIRRFTPPHMAYLKISEGCSNHCTYCTIPSIRGELESRGEIDILEEAKLLGEAGVKELVVIAQDTAAWGMDAGRKGGLYKLLEGISSRAGIEWVRLMYLHPAHIDLNRLISAMNDGVILRYADIPIQHASDRILARMGRGYTAGDLDALFGRLRDSVGGIVLRTTVMAGFPGETEDDFSLLMDFLERHRIDNVGAFAFSAERGTPAAGMEGAVDEQAVRERLDEISALQLQVAGERNSRFLGKRLGVLVDDMLAEGERPGEDEWGTGRTYGQAYEVDGCTFLAGSEAEPGSLVEAVVTGVDGYDLFASRTQN